jgi:hypothetical protein
MATATYDPRITNDNERTGNVTSTMINRPRAWLAASLAVAALLLAACGGGSSTSSKSSSSASSTSSAPAAASSTSSASSSAASGIPQGPNAGDKDTDNNGGPTDGDGNL